MRWAGGGWSEGGHRGPSETDLICDTWKVGLILMSGSLMADGLMIRSIEKDPMNLSASFLGVSLI